MDLSPVHKEGQINDKQDHHRNFGIERGVRVCAVSNHQTRHAEEHGQQAQDARKGRAPNTASAIGPDVSEGTARDHDDRRALFLKIAEGAGRRLVHDLDLQ